MRVVTGTGRTASNDVNGTPASVQVAENDREVARPAPEVDLLGFDRRGSAVFEYMPDAEGVAPG